MEKYKTLILGCGNPLFGDDGFGPAVVSFLNRKFKVLLEKNKILAIDAGTGATKILFDLVFKRESIGKVFVIDVVHRSKNFGKIFEINLDAFSKENFISLSHYPPSIEILKILKKQGLDVRIFVTIAKYIPNEVFIGLSKEVENSIGDMCRLILCSLIDII